LTYIQAVHGILDDIQSLSPDSSFQPSVHSSDPVETVMVDRTVTPSMVCSLSSTSDPKPIAKEKKLARLKRWESEQTAELKKMSETRNLWMYLSSWQQALQYLFAPDYYVDYRAQMFFLSSGQLDMVLLGSIASNLHDIVGTELQKNHVQAWSTSTKDAQFAERR